MPRRTHRYARPRQRNGTVIATLIMMAVLLLAILAVGGNLAGRLAGFFASPPPEAEEGVESLPPSLALDEGTAGDTGPTVDGELVPHTGALIRMAIRSASIVARRAIARGHTLPPSALEPR